MRKIYQPAKRATEFDDANRLIETGCQLAPCRFRPLRGLGFFALLILGFRFASLHPRLYADACSAGSYQSASGRQRLMRHFLIVKVKDFAPNDLIVLMTLTGD